MAVEEMLRGVQLGAGIASDRLNRNLREQELRSIEASRKLEERKVAQDLAFQLQQQNMATQYRADAEKAMRQTMIETSPVLPAPGSPMGVIPNPNQQPMERALLKNLGPVIGKYEPNKLGSFVQDIAMMPFRRAEAERVQAQADILKQSGTTTPAETQVKEFDDFSVVRTPDGKFQVVRKTGEKSFVPSDFEKRVADYEKRSGQKLSPDELKKYFDISMGAEPRAAVTPPVISEEDFIAKQLPSVRREDANAFSVRSDDERINELRKTYREIYKKADGENEDDIKARREKIRSDFRSGKITGSEATKLLRETGLK